MISIVAASRNDDHTGDLIARMTMFVLGLDEQSRRHRMGVELVLVDWNPPANRPHLSEVMPRPSSGSPLVIRHIVVSNEVHRRWRYAEEIPFFQWMAKNVGIRRARGKFVLATNVDLLFSDALCRFLAETVLDENTIYRACRCDVPSEFPFDSSLDAQLAFCHGHVLRCSASVPAKAERQAGWRAALRSMRSLLRRRGPAPSVEPSVDANASGDFTLLSKSAWEKVGGYPELELHAHVDALVCHAAVASGMRQVVLPMDHCVFHVEHRQSWVSMSPVEKVRLCVTRPSLDWLVMSEAARWMHQNHCSLGLNVSSWGCCQDVLEERIFTGH